jgi:hypothetical protein
LLCFFRSGNTDNEYQDSRENVADKLDRVSDGIVDLIYTRGPSKDLSSLVDINTPRVTASHTFIVINTATIKPQPELTRGMDINSDVFTTALDSSDMTYANDVFTSDTDYLTDNSDMSNGNKVVSKTNYVVIKRVDIISDESDISTKLDVTTSLTLKRVEKFKNKDVEMYSMKGHYARQSVTSMSTVEYTETTHPTVA